ncbi:MAG: TetR/AcrR family transcriptional regulator [Nitrososphaerales archaeon]|nr:TetR/AcrR family transcriptional regulator [Nitrososphaerales archaeon]
MQASDQRVTAGKILQAASKLFAEKGFANVSIRDVCKEAGTTAPVIYYYFRSKRGLFEAVTRSKVSMADLIGKLSRIVAERDASKALSAFIKTYLSSFPEHAFDAGLYMRDSATLDRESARMISVDLDKVRSLASDLIWRCMQEGVFRRTDKGLAADCLLGMLNRVIFQHLHFSKASDREAYGRFVTDFFFRAMK